jgi:hypothetical protein
MNGWLIASVGAAMFLAPVAARAADPEDADMAEVGVARDLLADSADAAAFAVLAQSAQVDRQRALAVGFAGYDGAGRAGLFESAAEVTVFGPLAIRGGAVYSPSGRGLRPSVGGKAQLLRSARHGVDGTVGVFYQPEGLTEPEGEIEGFAAIGGAIGRGYVVGNLLYGQDPEGRERDGEVRVSALRHVGKRVLVGIDGRCRFDLGSDAAKLAAHGEPTFDALAAPAVNVLVGSVALLAEAGASVRRIAGTTASGPFTMVGVGTAF